MIDVGLRHLLTAAVAAGEPVLTYRPSDSELSRRRPVPHFPHSGSDSTDVLRAKPIDFLNNFFLTFLYFCHLNPQRDMTDQISISLPISLYISLFSSFSPPFLSFLYLSLKLEKVLSYMSLGKEEIFFPYVVGYDGCGDRWV